MVATDERPEEDKGKEGGEGDREMVEKVTQAGGGGGARQPSVSDAQPFEGGPELG